MTVYSTYIGKGKDRKILTKRKKKNTGKELRDRIERAKAEGWDPDPKKDTQKERKRETERTQPTVNINKRETERPPRVESKTAPVVKLTPKPKEKTGLAKLREEDSIKGGLIRAATDWRTTVALVGTLATLGIGSAVIAGAEASASAGATAVITRTGTAISGGMKGVTMTTQRAFIGRAATSGVNKIFYAVRPVATRFATNPKSTALTTKLFLKAGLNTGTAGILLGAIGSYPFAGFIKEEALQTLGFAFSSAEKINDIEGMEMVTEEIDEILNVAPSILDKIPYVNVLKQLNEFFKAVAVKQIQNKRTIEEAKRDIEGEGEFETSFEKSARESAEREEKQRKESEEYYSRIEEENRKKELEEMAWKSEYFNLIREKKFKEAEELLKEKMK